MKRLLFALGFMLLSGVVCAQDTIVFKDGSSVLVKILDIDADGVHYKTWSNQNGPTWTKSYNSIKSIKRYGAKAASKSKIVKNKPKSEGSNLEMFERAVAAADEQNIIRYGQAYLNSGEEAELPRVVQTLALVYAARGNAQNTTVCIEKLKKYSSDNDDMFEQDIVQLQKETYALLHPRRLEDDMRGKWVLLEKVSYKGSSYNILYSPIILEIRDVSKSNGAYMLPSEQKVPRQKRMISPSLAYNNQINTSQALVFNGQNRFAAIQFASLVIKDRRGNTDLAHSILEDSRKMRAEMNATIRTSKANIEDKLAASALTTLTSAAMDIFAYSLNTSSKTDEVYNMVLFPKNDKVMNSYVSHVSATTTTTSNSDPNTVYNEYIKDKRMQFVRWEESDSMFFVSTNREPITLSTIATKDPVFDEYWQIKDKYSIKNPRYFIPMLSGTLLSGIMLSKAVKLLRDGRMKDEFGNEIQNPDGSYQTNDKNITNGVLLGVGAEIIAIFTFVGTPTSWISKREKAYMEINRRNIEKLRQKAKASMSVSPTYSAENKAMGAAINIQF